jgi:hypothetical protein
MSVIAKWVSFMALASIAFLAWAPGCGSPSGSNFGGSVPTFGGSSGGGTGNSAGGGTFGSSSGAGGLAGDGGLKACTGGNLCAQIHTCTSGSTTISGTVYDPAGKNPLYNIVAYVPNEPVKPLTLGASCYTCSDLYSGNPIATALTGPDGKFTIPNAPDGANIPLVIQIGKWRRQFTVPTVAKCQPTQIPDKTLLLPKNPTVGDPASATSIPNIGIATGGADSLECLLERVGVDPNEYVGGPGGTGHIHIFTGDNGATTQPPAPTASGMGRRGAVTGMGMWDTKDDLMKYDIAILSCEGHETTNMNQQALFDYAAAGGRVFASHFHYAWFNNGPFAAPPALATWTPGANAMAPNGTYVGGVIQTTLANGQPFYKGQALKTWLGNVGALGQNGVPAGELSIDEAKHNADVAAANTPSTAWIVADPAAMPPGATQYFSFDTPLNVAPAQQCGRVVFSDLHVGSASMDYNGTAGGNNGVVNGVVPGGCVMADLSPQEKALEFMLFDLSACIVPNTQMPTPPPGVAK